MSRLPAALTLFGWLLCAGPGCMYRFAAVGTLPGDLTRVRSPVFANHTAEPGLEAAFTGALRRELARAGVAADAGAEAELQGEVLGVWGGPTILTTPTEAQPAAQLASYRIFASARLSLVRGAEVLAQAEVVGSEDYLPAADILLTETNRQAALHRLTERLMRDGFDRLLRRAPPPTPSSAASSGG